MVHEFQVCECVGEVREFILIVWVHVAMSWFVATIRITQIVVNHLDLYMTDVSHLGPTHLFINASSNIDSRQLIRGRQTVDYLSIRNMTILYSWVQTTTLGKLHQNGLFNAHLKLAKNNEPPWSKHLATNSAKAWVIQYYQLHHKNGSFKMPILKLKKTIMSHYLSIALRTQQKHGYYHQQHHHQNGSFKMPIFKLIHRSHSRASSHHIPKFGYEASPIYSQHCILMKMTFC